MLLWRSGPCCVWFLLDPLRCSRRVLRCECFGPRGHSRHDWIGKRSANCVQACARLNHRQRCDLRLCVPLETRGRLRRQAFHNEAFRSI